ncbi:hypothetical protein [Methylomarinum vadi]|uniref:hypothetical protein n=1 Tax=Methylomarinum vadi TaxID=438855 RepID=UPI0004DF9EA7|nr:hypothetical protein [Methylomarinum vadi]
MNEYLADKAVLIYPQFDSGDTFWSYSRSLTLYSKRNRFGMPQRLLPPLARIFHDRGGQVC